MDIVPKYIGSWGRYQTQIFLMICPIFALFGVTIMAITFTGAIPNTRCFITGVDNDTAPDYHNQDPRLATLYGPPLLQRGMQQRCKICEPAETFGSTDISAQANESCTTDRATTCPDSRYIYDQSQYTSSLSMDFGLVCEEGAWKRELASSMYMVGATIGAYVGGYLGDRFGRRPVLVIGQIGGVLCMFLMLAVPNFILLCILQVITAIFIYSAYLSGYVIVMEVTGGFPRTVSGIGAAAIWNVGAAYVGIMAYFFRNWQYLQTSLALFGILTVPSFWFVPESVRWLLANGRIEDAEKNILNAGRINNKSISCEGLAHDLSIAKNGGDDQQKSEQASPGGIGQFLRHGPLLKMSLIVFYVWFAMSLTMFGIGLNTADLPGDTYVNYLLSAVVEFPGHASCIVLAERLGRRPTTAFFLGLGGVCIFICQFLSASNLGWLIVGLACVGRCGAAASFGLMYAYSAEMFPTAYRNAAMGIAGASARVGTILAPQVALLGIYLAPWLPFSIYGLAAFIGAIVTLLLPETLGAPMPQNIDDGLALVARKTPLCGRFIRKDTGLLATENGVNSEIAYPTGESKSTTA